TTAQLGTSGLWCIKQVYNYFSNVHSRPSYNGQNGALSILVNAGFNISPGNSLWRGNGEMWIGRAASGCGHPITIDNIGHEFSNGVIQTSANFPNVGESGAINEA